MLEIEACGETTGWPLSGHPPASG